MSKNAYFVLFLIENVPKKFMRGKDLWLDEGELRIFLMGGRTGFHVGDKVPIFLGGGLSPPSPSLNIVKKIIELDELNEGNISGSRPLVQDNLW